MPLGQARRRRECLPALVRCLVQRRSDAALGVSQRETASSADLGVSSKYSNENFEGRSGEGFHVKINSTWVSRP